MTKKKKLLWQIFFDDECLFWRLQDKTNDDNDNDHNWDEECLFLAEES